MPTKRSRSRSPQKGRKRKADAALAPQLSDALPAIGLYRRPGGDGSSDAPASLSRNSKSAPHGPVFELFNESIARARASADTAVRTAGAEQTARALAAQRQECSAAAQEQLLSGSTRRGKS